MPRDSRLYMTFPNDFWTHHKVAPLSDASFRAFVEMNGYSRMNDLDGVIPGRFAEFRWGAAVAELVASDVTKPLVLRDGEADTYVIRDYAEHQQTTADRKAKSERGSHAARSRWDAQRMHDASESDAEGLPEYRDQRTEVGNEVDGDVSSKVADATSRPEIAYLLDLLDSEIRANGGRTPSRTKKNIDACRLLIDKDGVRPDQIERAIRWCQADEFWRANILSMSKLREKYDQLRLAATRRGGAKMARADENAAEFYRLYGGDDERAGSIQALDPGVG